MKSVVLVAQSCPTFCDPWTVGCQAPLSMEFSRQEYWSGLSFPSPGDLPNPGIEPRSPSLQVNSLPCEAPGKSKNTGVGTYTFSRGSSQLGGWTWASCVTCGFFTVWATWEAKWKSQTQNVCLIYILLWLYSRRHSGKDSVVRAVLLICC